LVNELTTSQLINQQQRKLIVKTTNNADALMSLGKAGIGATINNANEIEIIEPSILDSPEQISTLLVSNGTPPTEIYLWKEDLEHYFLRTIKQSQE
jgi:ABC-2 type transport system ATP-binding protein